MEQMKLINKARESKLVGLDEGFEDGLSKISMIDTCDELDPIIISLQHSIKLKYMQIGSD